MAKKNFIPLCMMPFIANMMSDKPEEGGEEPELPYFTVGRMDIAYAVTLGYEESGGEGTGYYAEKNIICSENLKAAILANKDIYFPEGYDESWMVPTDVDVNNEASMSEYIAGLKDALESSAGKGTLTDYTDGRPGKGTTDVKDFAGHVLNLTSGEGADGSWKTDDLPKLTLLWETIPGEVPEDKSLCPKVNNSGR